MKLEGKNDLAYFLTDNPCRGVVVGLSEQSNPRVFSWIMGRSENSQNRIYVADGDDIKTAPFDASRVSDPSLIIYRAIARVGDSFVVGNGNQVDTVVDTFAGSVSSDAFFESVKARFCEPDAPTFTPRITAVYDGNNAYLSLNRAMSNAKNSWAGGNKEYDRFKFPTYCHRFEEVLSQGQGFCLLTYKPGSEVLPSFDREPLTVPISGSLDDSLEFFWGLLDPRWRVAIAGKEIIGGNVKTVIKNKHEV